MSVVNQVYLRHVSPVNGFLDQPKRETGPPDVNFVNPEEFLYCTKKIPCSRVYAIKNTKNAAGSWTLFGGNSAANFWRNAITDNALYLPRLPDVVGGWVSHC